MGEPPLDPGWSRDRTISQFDSIVLNSGVLNARSTVSTHLSHWLCWVGNPDNTSYSRRLQVPLDGVSATSMWNLLNIVCFLTVYVNGKAGKFEQGISGQFSLRVSLYLPQRKYRKSWVWRTMISPLFWYFAAAVGHLYKRLKSREGKVNDCPPRLAERVFKKKCQPFFTLCENDKSCKTDEEICVCNEHCGKVCVNPSKCSGSVFIAREN